MTIHARSLAPLVKARGFGMTPVVVVGKNSGLHYIRLLLR